MKKILSTIFIVVIIITAMSIPRQVDAAWWCLFAGPAACAANFVAGQLMMSVVAEIGNALLQISAWFLGLAGVILNVSIILTMNIKAIYQATPAIEQIWLVIRNISSIFIIFALIYTSIATILDVSKTGVKELVMNIIKAGLLINFSLFFTKVAIDASNLVSLQIYRAIAPTSQVSSIGKDDIGKVLSLSFTDGGISDVFMYNLKIQKIYNKTTNKNGILTDADGGAFFKIAVSTIAGSALMIIAGLSFFAASIAFVVRLVILLLLLGFSPVYFVGMIFPAIKSDISGKWIKWLEQQLVFMPVYLLFMYVAMRFIATAGPSGSVEGFFASLDKAQASAGSATTSGGILLSAVGIVVQYTIALILINIPLIAAMQSGGVSMKWGGEARNWVSSRLGSVAGRNTFGRLGKGLGEKFDKLEEGGKSGSYGRVGKFATSLSSNLGISKAMRGGLTNVEKSKYGYESLSDVKKYNKERGKELRGITRTRELDEAIAKAEASGGIDTKDIKTVLGKMSNSEIASLDTKSYLMNKHVAPNLQGAVYQAIEKGDKSDEDKVNIRSTRNRRLSDAVAKIDAPTIKNIMKNMSGDDLQKFIEDNYPVSGGTSSIPMPLIEHMRGSQLKDMDSLDEISRKQIGISIQTWLSGTHQAEKFIDDNKKAWT